MAFFFKVKTLFFEGLFFPYVGPYFENLALFVKKNLSALKSLCGKKIEFEGHGLYEHFVNVNAPAMKSYGGVEFASPCWRRYYERIEHDGDEARLVGSGKVVSYGNGVNDAEICGRGFVSVSVIKTEPAFKCMESMENTFVI